MVVKGYVSPNTDRREPMLERKRQEYHNFVEQYYSTRHQDIHRDTYRQVGRPLCIDLSKAVRYKTLTYLYLIIIIIIIFIFIIFFFFKPSVLNSRG